MITISYNGREYLPQSIVWVKYEYDRLHPGFVIGLQLRFSDGTEVQYAGHDAARTAAILEESFERRS
jgi:hypothetical protein